jgi:hypothetical protein
MNRHIGHLPVVTLSLLAATIRNTKCLARSNGRSAGFSSVLLAFSMPGLEAARPARPMADPARDAVARRLESRGRGRTATRGPR